MSELFEIIMVVSFGAVQIRTVACALILGILTNVMLSKEDENKDEPQQIIK